MIKTFTTKANANRAAKNLTAKVDFITSYLIDEVNGTFQIAAFINIPVSDVPEELKDRAEWEQDVEASKQANTEISKEAAEDIDVCEELRPISSTIKDPCKFVWDTADRMVGARRKDVINHCANEGIAYNTARTQYQLWFTAKKADAAIKEGSK